MDSMLHRPTTLSAERCRAIERRALDAKLELLDCIERLVADVDHEELRDRLYTVAFEGSDLLPKRDSRPKLEIVYLVRELCLAYDLSETALETVLECTVAITEYYDIVDDVVDGDVADGRTSEAILLSELLVPLTVARLGQLGPDATAFWADEALTLLEAPYVEATEAPSAEAYRRVVERQGTLFGFVTGLPPVVADADRSAVRRATTLGERYYAYEQFLLDGEQHGDDSPWNLWEHVPEDAALDRLSELQTEVRELVDPLPEQRARAIRALVGHDLEAWAEGL